MRSSRWSRPATPTSGQRKPRIVVAGEFSAGKTQLINGLVGSRVLPSNVTATALPPVWIAQGNPAMLAVGASGKGQAISGLDNVDLASTHYCVLTHPAPILGALDIIDTPGNSDPNMQAETWQRMLAFADAVVWCTNATQAWRQSEKAVWQAMPDRLRTNALVVITHADLMPDPSSAEKVLRRVEREAAPYFATFRMASLLKAEDIAWIASHLRGLTGRLGDLTGADNALVEGFVRDNPVRAVEQPTPSRGTVLPMVRPRRIERGAEIEAAERGAKVVPLKASQVLAGRAAAADKPPVTWETLSAPKAVQKSPSSLLKGVEALIAALDVQQSATAEGQKSPSTLGAAKSAK